jgi:hypothetical protein
MIEQTEKNFAFQRVIEMHDNFKFLEKKELYICENGMMYEKVEYWAQYELMNKPGTFSVMRHNVEFDPKRPSSGPNWNDEKYAESFKEARFKFRETQVVNTLLLNMFVMKYDETLVDSRKGGIFFNESELSQSIPVIRIKDIIPNELLNPNLL